MNYGLDTGFLVAAEVVEHPLHLTVRARLTAIVAGGDGLALAPQVVAEFIHVVTDGSQRLPILELRAIEGTRAA